MAKIARNIDPNDEDEPATMQEAINHPTRGKQWEEAFRNEYNSLIRNHTWDLVPRPKGRRIVTNKWALEHEKAAKQGLRYLNGTIDKRITYNGNLGMRLEFWSDANWGGEEGRESVSGFTGTLAGGAVTYSSKMMGMGVWQKSEDYAITKVGEEGKEDERNGERSNVADV